MIDNLAGPVVGSVVFYDGPERDCHHELFIAGYEVAHRGRGTRQGGTCLNPCCNQLAKDLAGGREASKDELAAALEQACLHLSQTVRHIRTLAMRRETCFTDTNGLRGGLSRYEATVQILFREFLARCK